MIYLSQADPRWASVTLGTSRFTIGRYGCTTTSISMLSDYFKCFQNPADISKNFCKYDMDGRILWNTLSLAHMAFETRGYGRNDDFIKAALKDPNRAIILNVNGGAHWVVALRRTLFGNDFVCADPWTGKTCTAVGTYKNIVGYASFIIK